MEPCGIPALTVYSYKDFPFKTTRNCLLLRKDKIDEISDMKFHKT